MTPDQHEHTGTQPPSDSPDGKALPPPPADDPHAVRMSLGEHLDELRAVVIRSLLIIIAAIILCIWPARFVLAWTVEPLIIALKKNGQPDSLLATSPVESLMMYAKFVIFLAIVLAAPFIISQIWSFVAKGLYKREKRWVYRLIPVSVGLFLVGVGFMYTFVLILSLNFLIGFGSWLPMPDAQPGAISKMLGVDYTEGATEGHHAPLLDAPVLQSDPPDPPAGSVWVNQLEQKLKVRGEKQTFSVQLARDESRGLVTTHFRLGEYLSFVLVLALAFGLAFQIPLVVVFLTKSGIISREKLASYRKGVILTIVIIAGMIAPPDLLSHVLLSIPMVLLFEIGLLFSPKDNAVAAGSGGPESGTQ